MQQREQLAKCRGVGFELLVTGDLQLQCAEALGTRVGLAEHAQAEQRDQHQQGGDDEKGDQQLRPNLRRDPRDGANEWIVRTAQQPPASSGGSCRGSCVLRLRTRPTASASPSTPPGS